MILPISRVYRIERSTLLQFIEYIALFQVYLYLYDAQYDVSVRKTY